MERSRKILLEISSVSQQVITSANKYADWKGLRCVPRMHVQLEQDMYRISTACNALADSLISPSLSDPPGIDITLQDWLCTEEPRFCLDTLTGMIKLLQTDTSFWTMLNPWRLQPAQDRIKEAVERLELCKNYFYFLFLTETLNNERGAQHQEDAPQSEHRILTERSEIRSKSSVASTQSSITIAIPNSPTQKESENSNCVVDKGKEPENGKEREETLKRVAKKREEILKWLDWLNCAEKQDMTLKLRQPDTCKWLFDTAQYKMWWDSETSSFWLQGKPGAGKSVLASSVIESLEKIQREGLTLAYFYCDFRNERSTNASEVFRSLLSQLLLQIPNDANDLESLSDDILHAKDRGRATWKNAVELAGYVSRTAELFTKKPCTVVDALDECKDVEELLDGLVVLKGHVRLFLTSRPLQLIKSGLSDFLGISMEDMAEELSADIGLHVTRELANRRRLRDLDADIKADIHTVLCHRADGMFRWVECSTDTLNRCVTLEGVQRALRNLPKGLEETYKRILLAINVATDEGKLALRALVWLVAALRPLKVQELMEGLSINPEKRVIDFGLRPMHREALLDACGSLVTYSEKTGIIILSHFSVKEYLISELTHAELPEYHIDWECAHLKVVQSCICYVSICLNGVREPNNFSIMSTGTLARKTAKCVDLSRLVLWRLRDYVFDDALDHLQYLGPLFGLLLDDITVLADVIKQHQLLWDNMCLSAGRVMGTTNPCWPTSNHDLVLYILVAFSSDSFLRAYLRRTVLKPKEGVNPLVYAAYFNKELHARILLSRGVRLDRRGWEVVGPHRALPFEVALENCHFAMLTLFVTEGSPVPANIFPLLFHEDNQGPPIPNSVRAMLLQTEDFVEAVYDLNRPFLPSLRRLFNMTKLETFGWESHIAIRRWLQVAEERGRRSLLIKSLYQDNSSKIINFLDNCGYGPLFSDSSIIEALRIALQKGHVSIVKYLLSLRRDIPFPSDILTLALNSPSPRDTDKTSLISLLIENGAYVRTCTLIAEYSPLQIALRTFSEEDTLHITKLLIRHGCDPLKANYPGDSLLHIAARRGHISVAQHLLSIGVPLPPDILFAMFDSQISHGTDHTSMVRLLIESGADIHARPYSVLCAPLRLLEGDKALQMTKLLVEYGCDLLQVDSEGHLPLHIAIEYRRTSVVQYLLSLGTPLPSDILSFAPLSDILSFTLSLWGLSAPDAVSMACLLIEHGADVHTRTSTGDSLLPTVLQLLHENDALALKITKLFIDRGFDPLEVDSRGESILHIAVRQSHTSVVDHLLSIGVCLPPDILLVASHSEPRSQTIACKVSIISLLIENGGNVHACTPAGDSVLRIALQSRLSDDHALHITKLLLNHGFDLLKADSPRKSLLRIAVESFNTSVVQYLVSLGVYLPPDILLSTLRSPRHVADEESIARLRVLLECGADVHACTSDGHPALHVILKSFDMSDAWAFRITELFVSHHFDPIKVDPFGRSILHIAVERGYIYATQYLLSLGVPLPRDILFYALQWRGYHRLEQSMVSLLIEHGADVHACTPAGNPLLHIALNTFSSEDAVLAVAKVLVNRGCNTLQVDSDGKSILHIAVDHGYISVTQYLLSLGVPLPRDILFYALQWKDDRQLKESMVSLLIEHGADVQTCTPGGDSALHVALKSSYSGSGITTSRSDYSSSALRIMKILVHQGCDPLQDDFPVNSLLRIAIKWDSDSESYSESATRYLLSLGISLPPDILLVAFGSVPTLGKTFNRKTTSSEQRQWEVQCLAPVDCLIENGANVHASTPKGNSALHIILRRSSFSEDLVLQITKFLVSHGFDPRKVDSPANSLLHIAVQQRYTSIVRYLLSFRIPPPPDSLSFELWTMGPETRDEDAVRIIKLLVDNGCDLPQDCLGRSPLHIGVRHHLELVVQYLLSLHIPLPSDILLNALGIESANTRDDFLSKSFESGTCVRTDSRDIASMACLLIENGAYVAMSIPDRKLVFDFVCDSESLEQQDALRITISLVNHGCDPLQIVNSRGESLLHTAVNRGRDSLAQCLILGLQIPLPPDILFVALNSPRLNVNYDTICDGLWMVYFLVEEGADVHAYTSHGDSVLRVALHTFRSDDECAFRVTRLLVDHGCDPAEVDAAGRTLLRVAVEQDLPSVVQYLRSLGADTEQTARNTGRNTFSTTSVEGEVSEAPSNPQTSTAQDWRKESA